MNNQSTVTMDDKIFANQLRMRAVNLDNTIHSPESILNSYAAPSIKPSDIRLSKPINRSCSETKARPSVNTTPGEDQARRLSFESSSSAPVLENGRISSRESQTKLLQIFHAENLDLKMELNKTKKQLQELQKRNESLEIENQRLNKTLHDYSRTSSPTNESKVSETDLFNYRQTVQREFEAKVERISSDYELEIDKLKQQISDIIAKDNIRIRELQEQVITLKQHVDVKSDKIIEEKNQTIKELEEMNNQNENKISELLNIQAELEFQIQSLQQDNSFTTNTSDLSRDENQLEESVHQCHIKDLEQQNKHLTTTINEISSQLLIKEQTITNLHNINTQLNKQLQQIQQQQQIQPKPKQLEQQQLLTLSPNTTTQSSPEGNGFNGDIQHDEMMNILSLNEELKKCYTQLRDEREKNEKLGEEHMRLKNIYDYEEKEYKNIILSLRNENTTIKDELEKLQRYYSGLNHAIETSSPIFKQSRDSEMEVLLEKVSLFQKRNEKMSNLLDVKMEENNQLKNELASLHLEYEDLKLKYNGVIELYCNSNDEPPQQQQIISENEGEEEEENNDDDDDTMEKKGKIVKDSKEKEELMKENENLKNQIQEFTHEKDEMKVTLSKLIKKINQLSIIKDENDDLKTQLRSTTKSSINQTGKTLSPTIQKIKLNSVTDENEDLKIQIKKDEKYINELQENTKYYQEKYEDLLKSYHIMVKQYKSKSPSSLRSTAEESKNKSVLEDIYMYLCQLYKCCELECPKRLVSYENITPLLASIVPIIKARLQKALDLEEAYNYKLSLISNEHYLPRRMSNSSPARRL